MVGFLWLVVGPPRASRELRLSGASSFPKMVFPIFELLIRHGASPVDAASVSASCASHGLTQCVDLAWLDDEFFDCVRDSSNVNLCLIFASAVREAKNLKDGWTKAVVSSAGIPANVRRL